MKKEAPVFYLEKTTFVINGVITNGGNQRLFVDGVEILPGESQKLVNHSPDGFSWGYSGSGPAQSALAICLQIFKNQHVAEVLYQSFKETFVSHWQPAGAPFQKEIDITDFLIDRRDRLQVALEREKNDQEWMESEVEEISLSMLRESVEEKSRGIALQPIRVEQVQSLRFWQVGDLVTITHPSEEGVNALVYEVYDRPDNSYGISLIAEDGRNLGGWEPETWKFLELNQATDLAYSFDNVGKLNHDYQKGLFTPYFGRF
ncbi:hypothetical protein GO730_38095 [Spirosoma sp. HMF3257]|uniref:Uncharacterized protein n=1 Tax=Spirosoma telluris TaxID=2183553 RepID=A0A327NKJ0_9BACT|nr:hypothetical protein [Spirosoma telluris]MVM42133.1 hypothetical protein [Spirosoma telluris]RAI73048.1 hypothetical protein HMF3257_37225 [Spirosoma telluris]RAI73179.1 hypothetical protein HMF3257_37995 [Spirosoma telluris]